MADKSIDICKTKYQEDISVLAAGTELIGHPATIWNIIISKEPAGAAVISFSDSTTAYDPSALCLKIVTGGATTEWNGFGKGFNVTNGLCATSNAGSVDIAIVYE